MGHHLKKHLFVKGNFIIELMALLQYSYIEYLQDSLLQLFLSSVCSFYP